MKKTKRCPKCNSIRIGHIATQPDADNVVKAEGAAHEQGLDITPRTVGQGDLVDTGLLRWGVVTKMIGALEAYVCADCGLYESYVVDPPAMEWEQIRDFSWVNVPPEPDGPYR